MEATNQPQYVDYVNYLDLNMVGHDLLKVGVAISSDVMKNVIKNLSQIKVKDIKGFISLKYGFAYFTSDWSQMFFDGESILHVGSLMINFDEAKNLKIKIPDEGQVNLLFEFHHQTISLSLYQ